MKSPMMIANPALAVVEAPTMHQAAKNGYSNLRVLQSAAGHYIGTLYEEFDANGNLIWQEPGSRDSGYFATEDEAALELKQMQGGDLSQTRWNP